MEVRLYICKTNFGSSANPAMASLNPVQSALRDSLSVMYPRSGVARGGAGGGPPQASSLTTLEGAPKADSTPKKKAIPMLYLAPK